MPQSQPNYLTTQQDGTVRARFTGGLELPIPATTDPYSPEENKITWTRDPSGGEVASITGRVGSTGYANLSLEAGTIDLRCKPRNSFNPHRILNSDDTTPLFTSNNTVTFVTNGLNSNTAGVSLDFPFKVVTGIMSLSGFRSTPGTVEYHVFLYSGATQLAELGSSTFYFNTSNTHQALPALPFQSYIPIKNSMSITSYNFGIWTPYMSRNSDDWWNIYATFSG